jgi:hypothetical protein
MRTIAALCLLVAGCLPDLPVVGECLEDFDCAGGELCINEACVPRADAGETAKDAAADAAESDGTVTSTDAGAPDAQDEDAAVEDVPLPDAGFMFPYAPSNFTPRSSIPSSVLRVAAGTTCTFDTDALTFDGCSTLPAAGDVEAQMFLNTPARLVHVSEFDVQGTLNISGSSAVVFAVYGHATIEGAIDIPPGDFGGSPGGDFECALRSDGNPEQGMNRGGGGGGGFGGPGAMGGRTGGGFGGDMVTTELAPLRGGCDGSRGSGMGGGNGGNGGGAIQISSAMTMTIRGSIGAPGSGGRGGGDQDGGGGGGSGGAILLEANDLFVETATLAATGGGGGGGGGDMFGQGDTGMTGTLGTAGGNGGGSPSNGGRGGDGGGIAPAAEGGTPQEPNAGGGGGGGGPGVIVLYGNACTIEASVIAPSYARRTLGSNACP